MLGSALTPVSIGNLGDVHREKIKHALVVHLDNPQVRQIIQSPEVLRMFQEMRAAIEQLTHPKPSPQAVLHGLGDGSNLGFAWLLPLIQGFMSSSGQGGNAPAGGAPSGGITDIISSVMSSLTHRPAGQAAPGATPGSATITMDQVAAAIQGALNARGMRAAPATGPGYPPSYATAQQHGCHQGDVWSEKYAICYSPAYYATEEEAYHSMPPSGPPGVAQPMIQPHTASIPAARHAARHGHKARGSHRRMHGTMINGVYLGDADDMIDATGVLGAAEAPSTISAAAIILGALAVAVGTSVLAVRAHRSLRLHGYRRGRRTHRHY